MHLLQSAGCPDSELQTLKNTVANQEVPELKHEHLAFEEKKRSDYRKQKPKKRIAFNLDENGVLEFRKEQIVKLHDIDLSSASRNSPATKPLLVKFEEVKEPVKSPRADQQPEITPEVTVPDSVEAEVETRPAKKVENEEEAKLIVVDRPLENKEKLVVVLNEQTESLKVELLEESKDEVASVCTQIEDDN